MVLSFFWCLLQGVPFLSNGSVAIHFKQNSIDKWESICNKTRTSHLGIQIAVLESNFTAEASTSHGTSPSWCYLNNSLTKNTDLGNKAYKKGYVFLCRVSPLRRSSGRTRIRTICEMSMFFNRVPTFWYNSTMVLHGFPRSSKITLNKSRCFIFT